MRSKPIIQFVNKSVGDANLLKLKCKSLNELTELKNRLQTIRTTKEMKNKRNECKTKCGLLLLFSHTEAVVLCYTLIRVVDINFEYDLSLRRVASKAIVYN